MSSVGYNSSDNNDNRSSVGYNSSDNNDNRSSVGCDNNHILCSYYMH